jgi:hypothetical protein
MSWLITPQNKVPVDPYIANVSLLLHGDGAEGAQNNTFLDSSTNNFTITREGNPTQGSFSPYGKAGGSSYFDGSNTASRLNIGTPIGATDNFTISFWYYLDSFSTASGTVTAAVIPLLSNFGWYNNFDVGISIHIASSTTIFAAVATGGGTTSSPPNTQLTATIDPLQKWNHIALVRDGATIRFFVNGVGISGTLSSNTGLNHAARSLYVGGWFSFGGGAPSNSRFPKGYISDLRIVTSALYSGNFTPPTTPSTAITGTSRLLSFTNAGIVDSAAKNNLETVGNAQISTAQSKFGGGSIAFDGNGDYLTMPGSSSLALRSGNFTIEAWVYPTALSVSQTIVDCRTSPSDASGFFFGAANNTQLQVYAQGAANIIGGTLVNNQWQHVCAVRNGTTLTLYINGSSVASATNSTDWTRDTVTVGAAINTLRDQWNGYIDDLRITKGIARYTDNFTPPTAPFGDI